MGARCVIRFTDSREPSGPAVARIYLHHGGETFDDVADTMQAFMRSAALVRDNRFDDPAYLAARLVVWAALQNGSSGGIDFLGVGVVDSEGYGDYVGTFCCGSMLRAFAGPSVFEQREVARVGVTA